MTDVNRLEIKKKRLNVQTFVKQKAFSLATKF